MKNLTKKQWVIVVVVIALIGGGAAYKTKHHRRAIMSSAFENYVRTGEPLDRSSRLQTALGLKPSASYNEIWEALRDEPVGRARLCPESRASDSVFLHVYEFKPHYFAGGYEPSFKAITPLAVNGMPVPVTKDGGYGYPPVPPGATYIELAALPNPAAPDGKVIVEWRAEDFRGWPGIPSCMVPFAVPVALKTGETIRIPIERTD